MYLVVTNCAVGLGHAMNLCVWGMTFGLQEWSYFRGGLTTIDRDYGIFNKIHHDIGTHVVHHLFPQVGHSYTSVHSVRGIRTWVQHSLSGAHSSPWSPCLT